MTATAMVEVDGCRNRKPCRWIPRTDPVELSLKPLAEAVGNHERMCFGMPRWRRPQEAASFWSHQPFVAITDVPIGTNCWNVEREHARCMRAVDQNLCTSVVTYRCEFTNRKDDGGRRSYVVENSQPRAPTKSRGHRVDDLPRIAGGKWHSDHHYACPSAGGIIFGRFADRRITVVRHQNFVARGELHRSQGCVAASSRIFDKGKIRSHSLDKPR